MIHSRTSISDFTSLKLDSNVQLNEPHSWQSLNSKHTYPPSNPHHSKESKTKATFRIFKKKSSAFVFAAHDGIKQPSLDQLFRKKTLQASQGPMFFSYSVNPRQEYDIVVDLHQESLSRTKIHKYAGTEYRDRLGWVHRSALRWDFFCFNAGCDRATLINGSAKRTI